jgi:hypothetical protein
VKSQPEHAVAKSFQELRRLLSETEEGLEEHVSSKLSQGDVWSVPDDVTGFGDKDKHPWVVIKGHRAGRNYVVVSPRTTTFEKSDDGKRGIITPAGVIADLDKEGLILLKHRTKLTVEEFRDFLYLGRLPEKWIRAIQAFQRKSVKSRK